MEMRGDFEFMEEVIDKEVPLALVKTWVTLARNKDADQDVVIRALSMLREKIGTPDQISAYMKKHNIR